MIGTGSRYATKPPKAERAPRSGSPADQGHCSHPNRVWAAPPLRPDIVFGRPRKSIMKRARTGIAIVGILAVTVGVETANAQSYRRYGAARTYTPQPYPPQSRGSIPRGVPRTVPFSDPNGPEATGGGNPGYNRGLPDGGY